MTAVRPRLLLVPVPVFVFIGRTDFVTGAALDPLAHVHFRRAKEPAAVQTNRVMLESIDAVENAVAVVSLVRSPEQISLT